MRMSELSDKEWRRLKKLLPLPRKGRGRPGADDRKTLNGILYVLRTGCRWDDFLTKSTAWKQILRPAQDGHPRSAHRSPSTREYWLNVHDGRPVEGFEIPHEHAGSVDRGDVYPVQPDRIRPVLGPGADTPVLGFRGSSSRGCTVSTSRCA
jgi:transposase